MSTDESQTPQTAVKDGSTKFRYYFIVVGSLLAILALFITDPESRLVTALPFGAAVIPKLIGLTSAIIVIGLLHYARRALLDYIDLSALFAKAAETPQGAGLAVIAVGLVFVAIAIAILAAGTIF